MSAIENDLPTFKTNLPFSGEEILFRPFKVKEEKVLIMANEGDNIRDVTTAVENIVKACTFGVVTADKYSMFDVQHMWLQLRGKSISEDIGFMLVCECKHQTSASVNVEGFEFRESPDHAMKIDLGPCQVQMRYPSYAEYAMLYETLDGDRVYDVVAACIERIIRQEEVEVQTKDNVKEFREFVDNITPAQLNKLEKFFETMPVLEHKIKYTCANCQKVNEVTIDGVRNFFE